jgi:hypothetical protein
VHHEVDEKAANDVGLWLRLARYGTVAYLDTPLIALRRHSQSQTVSTGIRTLADAGGYAASFETIEQVRMVLDRFASRYGGDPVPARELRARARRSTRGRVATVIRHQAGSAGDRRELARLFARGLRVEPTLAVSADGVELLATIALGDGAASLVRRARPWLRSARAPFASSVRQTP